MAIFNACSQDAIVGPRPMFWNVALSKAILFFVECVPYFSTAIDAVYSVFRNTFATEGTGN